MALPHTNNDESLLRIDDVAHLSGVPSRTIRFYNTQGLLPEPVMRGRVAYYNQEHLLVLRLIKELKEQQNLPLDVIRQLLEIRALHGDVQMNLALKQRLLRPLTSGGQEVRLSREGLLQQTGASGEQVDELVRQALLFPVQSENGTVFTGDDVLLLELYQRLEQLGLPLALASLIRFHLRQLVRSEIAAFEQYVLPGWRESGMSIEQQGRQFEEILTLTDTLISVLHRKML
jgi:DNA-binding transcriptional MerR regulator